MYIHSISKNVARYIKWKLRHKRREASFYFYFYINSCSYAIFILFCAFFRFRISMPQPWSMWIYHQAARSNSLHRGYHITPRSRERINEVGAPSKIKLCCTNLFFKRPLLNFYLGHQLNCAFRQIVKQDIWCIKYGLFVCFFHARTIDVYFEISNILQQKTQRNSWTTASSR